MSKNFNNKIIRAVSLLVCSLICAAICLLITACNRKDATERDSSPCYDISAEYDVETSTLSASQEILYTARQDSDCAVLHIYANAFSQSYNAIDILSLQIDRQTVDYEIYGEDRTLLKAIYPFIENSTYIISCKYTVRLPHSDSRLGVTEDGIVNLTCFYPVLARYDGGWREDCYSSFGDPFFSDISSFYVNLTVDENINVASSGEIVGVERRGAKGKKTVEISAENIRDFGMAAGQFESLSESVRLHEKEVTVNYCYYSDKNPTASLERAVSSIAVFSQAFGDYSHSSFTVVESNLQNAGGMEYGSFVLVSPTPSYESYLDTITHETAHQWWYDAVGSDQLNSAWLDEGLTEFCTNYFHYLSGDRTAHTAAMSEISRSYSSFSALKPTVGFDGRMNRHLSTYLTEGEYVAVTYYKGALLFDTLRTLVGDEKFQAALKQYYKDNMLSIANEQSLCSAFKTQGYDIESIVSGWTNDTAII